MKQGEIWLVCLDPTIGSEIKKTRPAVIVNDNALGKLPLKLLFQSLIGKIAMKFLPGWQSWFRLTPPILPKNPQQIVFKFVQLRKNAVSG